MQFSMKAAPAVCNTSMQKSIHSFGGCGPVETACVVEGVVDGGSGPPATPGAAALPDVLVDHDGVSLDPVTPDAVDQDVSLDPVTTDAVLKMPV